MSWVWSVGGLLLVGAVLADVTLTLWYPRGQGVMSRRVMTWAWRLAHRVGDGVPNPLVGPLSVVGVILGWGASVVLAWTLVYLPHMPEGFSFSPGLVPSQRSDLLDALYLSLVSSATLGLGDVVPTAAGLRLLVPLQALVGFLILTAVVTWSLQIHPVLGRRRALAARLAALAPDDVVLDPDDATSGLLVQDLAQQVAEVRADLAQYSETYVFRDGDASMSLPAQISVAQRIATQAAGSRTEAVVAAAAVLHHTLQGLADVVRPALPPADRGLDPAEVLDAWARDHGHPA